MKEIQKETKQEDLHPERYDEALFRKAFKAGMELKELNDREKKKKTIIQVGLSILFLLLVSLGIYYFVNNQPPAYTIPVFREKKESFLVYSPTKIYGFDNLDIEVKAKSAIAFDPDSGEVFFEKDIDTRRQIASLTKTMTSIIVMDNFNLDTIVTVDEIPKYGEEEIWSIELEKGDKITVENLLNMMLISSFNDAASVLAESVESEIFIAMMNEKAKVLGLEDTSFSNPCGFDNEKNYSTVSELRNIISAFLHYPTLTDIVDNSSKEVEYVRDGEVVKNTVFTTNSLLENSNVKGIKTGYTEDAGESLITLFEYEDGSRVVTILLNSEERYEDTEKIEQTITDLKSLH